MIIYIALAIMWFGITGLVSIDFLERLVDKYHKDGNIWRPIIGGLCLMIFAPFIGLGGVCGTMMEILCDDNDDDNLRNC